MSAKIQLHPRQADFFESKALYRGFVGGRGSGKSWIGAFDLLMKAKPGRTYLIASPTGIIMGDTTFPTVTKIARELGILKRFRTSPYPNVELTTGATIRFRTVEDPERARGPNLSGAWLDEGSLMKQAAYDIVIACLREGGEQGWLTTTFTGKGLNHWTYKKFKELDKDGKPPPNTELFHCTTKDNPFLPEDFQATLEGQYGANSRFALQELGGEFVSMEGVEWPAEFFGPHIWFDEWPKGDIILRVMALDPSKGKGDKSGDPSAWIMLGVDKQWNLWVDASIEWRPVEPLAGADWTRTIIGDGLTLYRQFTPSAILVETNGFQEMVATALFRHGQTAGFNLPIWTRNSNEPKPARIRKLGPYLAQRRLRVKRTPGGQMLVAQLRDFTGDPRSEVHDDGPDALQMAEQLADHIINGHGQEQGPQLLRA